MTVVPALHHIAGQAPTGSCAVDAFAAVFRVDASSLRQDVQSAANYTTNMLAIRRENRKVAADGKCILTTLIPKAERSIRQVARLDSVHVGRSTIVRTGEATERLVETAIRQAKDLSATLCKLQAERDYPRLGAGGGTDQNQLAATLIERLALIWLRYTNRTAPGGASGPFCEFVAAAWTDLGFPEFCDHNGDPLPLLDAIGGRIRKFYLRHNRDEKNQELGTKRPTRTRASSHSSKRR